MRSMVGGSEVSLGTPSTTGSAGGLPPRPGEDPAVP